MGPQNLLASLALVLVLTTVSRSAPSLQGTVVYPSGGSISDVSGNIWTITSKGQVAINGVTDTTTAGVIELVYVSGVVWQENNNYQWWGKTSPDASWLPTMGTSISPISSSTLTGNYYVGCFVDSGNRELNGGFMESSSMTNDMCRHFCGVLGYAYAGTENFQECYCGNSYGSYGSASESDCNNACAGNNAQMCGGGWRTSVYQTDYMGCFIDGNNGNGPNAGARDLPNQVDQSNSMTVEICMNKCASAGYAFAGVQYGIQCFCGNSYGSQGLSSYDSDCNMPCAGNSAEKCGAGWRNSIYQVHSLTSSSLPRSLKIMPMGDSFTAGGGTAVNGGPPPGSYRAPLYTLLTNAGYTINLVGDQTSNPGGGLPSNQDEHEGIGGINSINLLSHIQQTNALSIYTPDVILLMMGVNDMFTANNPTDPNGAISRITNLINYILSTLPNVKIILSNLPLPMSAGQEGQQFNALIPGLRSISNRITTVDMSSFPSDGTGPDGLHPNVAGCQAIANVFAAGVEAL